MKKVCLLGLASAAMLVAPGTAAASVAQEPLNVQLQGDVTPNSGGKKKKPENGRIRLAFTVNQESRKTVSRITYYIPKDLRLSGTGFRYCPASTLNAELSEESCPKGSKVGTGKASAVLGPQFAPLNFDVGVYAGSKNELALFLEGTDNEVVTAFQAPITAAGGDFGQKITVNIPDSVQQPVPALFAYITSVYTTIGAKFGKKVEKKRKSFFFASLRGCPSDRTHDFAVELDYVANDAGEAGNSGRILGQDECRR